MSQELYSFENAKMHLTAATIIPPIYYVEVSGETGSLNPTINLVNTGSINNGYLELEVQGNDGIAIGTMSYSRSIDVSEVEHTQGVIIKGANKEVKLEWSDVNQLSSSATTGLFLLQLQSESQFLGAPILQLQLTVDTVNNNASGGATVTQPLAKPVVCSSHVTGNLIYETVMAPGKSMIRVDLTGYPVIHWPAGGGVGPVILKNFTAMILFDENWNNGTVHYQYATSTGWVKECQKISFQK